MEKRNCICIGDYSGALLVAGQNIVLIGQHVHRESIRLPDNFISIAGVFEGVIQSSEWPAAVTDFHDEMLMFGVPQALAALVEPFGIDPEAARKAAALTLNQIRRARKLREI